MPETTDQPPTSDSTPLRPNRILDEPATVQACQADYARRSTVRARIAFAVVLDDTQEA